jgi:hypothetical protein
MMPYVLISLGLVVAVQLRCTLRQWRPIWQRDDLVTTGHSLRVDRAIFLDRLYNHRAPASENFSCFMGWIPPQLDGPDEQTLDELFRDN